MYASNSRWVEGSLPIAGVGLCTNSWQVSFSAHPGVHSPGSHVQPERNDDLLPRDMVQATKAQGARIALFPTWRDVIRLLGLTILPSWFSPSEASLMLFPVLPEENIQVSSWSFQTNKYYIGRTKIPALMVLLHVTAKLIHWPPVNAIVTADASVEGYRGYMNNLFFKGQWPGRRGRDTHIILLKLEAFWKAHQQFREKIKGK